MLTENELKESVEEKKSTIVSQTEWYADFGEGL